MIKVPASREGLPAIRQLTSEGINVNITLLFALSNHEKVMEAYLRGLERRVEAGQPLGRFDERLLEHVGRVDPPLAPPVEAQADHRPQPLAVARIQFSHGRTVAGGRAGHELFGPVGVFGHG